MIRPFRGLIKIAGAAPVEETLRKECSVVGPGVSRSLLILKALPMTVTDVAAAVMTSRLYTVVAAFALANACPQPVVAASPAQGAVAVAAGRRTVHARPSAVAAASLAWISAAVDAMVAHCWPAAAASSHRGADGVLAQHASSAHCAYMRAAEEPKVNPCRHLLCPGCQL
jgi:hypothetical protein